MGGRTDDANAHGPLLRMELVLYLNVELNAILYMYRCKYSKFYSDVIEFKNVIFSTFLENFCSLEYQPCALSSSFLQIYSNNPRTL